METKENESKVESVNNEAIEKINIEGTEYSLYRLSQSTLTQDDTEMKYGIIRNKSDMNLKYDHNKHREQYDKIASFVVEHCRNDMVKKYGMVLKEFSDSTLVMSNEFLSGNSQANEGKTAVVLIQGTGAVRSGIWTRSVCINDDMMRGSMLPQVEWAVMKGYPVLVMDPNAGQGMQDHATDAWKTFVELSGFSRIHIIAHSAGGGCLSEIQTQFAKTFFSQAGKIAYTDSWVISASELLPAHLAFMQKNAIHYQSSEEPLGQQLSEFPAANSVCQKVSAGHPRHEYSTGHAWPMIALQFDSKVVTLEEIEASNKASLPNQSTPVESKKDEPSTFEQGTTAEDNTDENLEAEDPNSNQKLESAQNEETNKQ